MLAVWFGCWEQNCGPLQELWVLLSSKPSLQPQFIRIYFSKENAKPRLLSEKKECRGVCGEQALIGWRKCNPKLIGCRKSTFLLGYGLVGSLSSPGWILLIGCIVLFISLSCKCVSTSGSAVRTCSGQWPLYCWYLFLISHYCDF